jgi:hypothetical protein
MKRHYYDIIKEKLDKGEIKEIIDGEFSVHWNQGGCNGMGNEQYDNLNAAVSRCKELTQDMLGERYAEREDFPTISKDFRYIDLDGKKHFESDTIIYGYYSYV